MRHVLRTVKNVITVASVMVEQGIPHHKAKQAWDAALEAHRQDVHKQIWEAKKQGLVWEDSEGRLWSTKTHPKGENNES